MATKKKTTAKKKAAPKKAAPKKATGRKISSKTTTVVKKKSPASEVAEAIRISLPLKRSRKWLAPSRRHHSESALLAGSRVKLLSKAFWSYTIDP